jgi:uncharacterized protein CbrC (UPF0167 family)
MELPDFRYHPDPLRTGSIKESDAVCIVCKQARGYVYALTPYGKGEYTACICPWCIADGTAHEQLQVEFNDAAAIGGWGQWSHVAPAVIEAVAYRTPGFAGWQGEMWFTHCGDAAAFLGVVGHKELLEAGPEAIAAIRQAVSYVGDDEWEPFLRSLDKNGSPTAYLFRCLHCGAYGGYADYD